MEGLGDASGPAELGADPGLLWRNQEDRGVAGAWTAFPPEGAPALVLPAAPAPFRPGPAVGADRERPGPSAGATGSLPPLRKRPTSSSSSSLDASPLSAPPAASSSAGMSHSTRPASRRTALL